MNKPLLLIFTIIGVFWVGECIHEIVHLIELGGHHFVVGFGIMPDYWVFGGISLTKKTGSEFWPYVFELLFFYICYKSLKKYFT